MKPDLQRIEAALKQLGDSLSPPATPAASALSGSSSSAASISFKVQDSDEGTPVSVSSAAPAAVHPPMQEVLSPRLTSEIEECAQSSLTSAPLSAEQSTPALPKLEISDTDVPPYDAERVLQMMQTLEGTVREWHTELQQIPQRIQALEAEGPAIHGWLESQPMDPAASSLSVLRHADVDELMAYVDGMYSPSGDRSVPRNRYILCGYDANEQVWSRPCPPGELSSVSMAIARYQTLSQLRERQQSLERRLRAIALQITQMYQQYTG